MKKLTVIALLLSSIVSAQIPKSIRNGKIKSKCNILNSTLEITYKNDSVIGEYKLWDNNNILTEEGYFDNSKHNYDTTKGVYREMVSVYTYGEGYKKYFNNLSFQDTSSMLYYDYEHSYKLNQKLFKNGKLISQDKYKIIKIENKYHQLPIDTSYTYGKEGQITDIMYGTIVDNRYYKSLLKTYNNYKTKNYYNVSDLIKDLTTGLIVQTNYEFDKKGHLLRVKNFIDGKEQEQIIEIPSDKHNSPN